MQYDMPVTTMILTKKINYKKSYVWSPFWPRCCSDASTTKAMLGLECNKLVR